MTRHETFIKTFDCEMNKKYIVGQSDCFMTQCVVVDALSNTTLVDKYSNRYTTLFGGMRVLLSEGFETLYDLWRDKLEETSTLNAIIGDIVIIQIEGSQHGGFCTGTGFVMKSEKGKVFVGSDIVTHVFKVGR